MTTETSQTTETMYDPFSRTPVFPMRFCGGYSNRPEYRGGEGAPVAFMLMRETCGKFIKEGEQE